MIIDYCCIISDKNRFNDKTDFFQLTYSNFFILFYNKRTFLNKLDFIIKAKIYKLKITKLLKVYF